MRMLVEALECDGIMHLAVGISSIMESNERRGIEDCPIGWMLVVVQSVHQTNLEVRKMAVIATHLSHGMILTRSYTVPVPSSLRAQTGWSNG